MAWGLQPVHLPHWGQIVPGLDGSHALLYVHHKQLDEEKLNIAAGTLTLKSAKTLECCWHERMNLFLHSFSCTYLCECNLLIIKNKIVTKINHFVCLYCVMVTHLFHEKTDQTDSKTTDLDFLFHDLLWKMCFMKHMWLWCYNPVISTLN